MSFLRRAGWPPGPILKFKPWYPELGPASTFTPASPRNAEMLPGKNIARATSNSSFRNQSTGFSLSTRKRITIRSRYDRCAPQ